MSDTVKGYQKGHAQVNIGTLNAVFDNTATTGLHAVLGTAGAKRLVTVCYGMRAAPVDGDECFNGQFIQGAYKVESSGAVTATIPFQGWAADGTYLAHASPWGTLLHANAARLAVTGANTAVGFDNPTGAATAKGAIFYWQVTAGDGTATIRAQDAAVNNDGGYADCLGLTSGVINCAVKQYGTAYQTGAIRQFVRWQITFGTANTVTFLSALCRVY